jgi:hypothetical protein
MAQMVLPRVQAMVLCDDVDRSVDERGVYHLTGVRTTMAARSFPAIRPLLCVFLQLSGHQGAADCHVQIFNGASKELIFLSNPKAVIFRDPTATVPVRFRLRNCIFRTPGVYYVEMLADNKVIGERRLHLRQED